MFAGMKGFQGTLSPSRRAAKATLRSGAASR
jgi:hypothetical protein